MRDVRDDAADEREQHPRAFDQQERMQLIIRHALDQKNSAIFQLHQEQRVVIGLVLGRHLELGNHVIGIGNRPLARVQRHAHLDVGLHLGAAQTFLRHQIFE